MDTNAIAPENTLVVIHETAQPTVKEQVVAAGVALAVTTVTTVLFVGAVSAFGYVSEKVADHKRAKAAAKATATTPTN